MVLAEADADLEEGALVTLVAVPYEEGDYPGGTATAAVEAGEYVDVQPRGAAFAQVGDEDE